VGIAAAIFTAYAIFATDDSDKRRFFLAEFFRALLATTSVGGLVLVPVDIIATLVRIYQHQKELSSAYQFS
jgi:hypothetical protein